MLGRMRSGSLAAVDLGRSAAGAVHCSAQQRREEYTPNRRPMFTTYPSFAGHDGRHHDSRPRQWAVSNFSRGRAECAPCRLKRARACDHTRESDLAMPLWRVSDEAHLRRHAQDVWLRWVMGHSGSFAQRAVASSCRARLGAKVRPPRSRSSTIDSPRRAMAWFARSASVRGTFSC